MIILLMIIIIIISLGSLSDSICMRSFFLLFISCPLGTKGQKDNKIKKKYIDKKGPAMSSKILTH